jgi:hypothetical protein
MVMKLNTGSKGDHTRLLLVVYSLTGANGSYHCTPSCTSLGQDLMLSLWARDGERRPPPGSQADQAYHAMLLLWLVVRELYVA